MDSFEESPKKKSFFTSVIEALSTKSVVKKLEKWNIVRRASNHRRLYVICLTFYCDGFINLIKYLVC